MKKAIKILLIVLFVLTTTALIWVTVIKFQKKQSLSEDIKTLQPFTFYTLTGKRFTNKLLDKEKAVLLMYFNPECEHCQYEAREINKNQQEFSLHQILMVTTANTKSIASFGKEYGLDRLTFLRLLHDKEHQMPRNFGVKTVPASFIYDKNGKLIKQFQGEVKPEALLKFLNK